jgi:glycosyltransferase involved in cell wall biosynthesis
MSKAFFQQCPECAENQYLLFLSRIHNKKGVDLLVKAYAAVTKRLKRTPFKKQTSELPKLVIAGPGMETLYGGQIKQLASEFQEVADHIFFPGMLSGKAKWGAIYGCQAFILPSHQENFGIAVVEALSCEKAVLISNQVNIWKEIEESGAGIAADDTVEGTIQLLESWFRLSKNQQTDMGLKAGDTYKKYFAIEQATVRLYKAMT